MNINISNENGICHIGMNGKMTINSAAQIKENLFSAIASGNEIELNLNQVSEIDTAGLQLLALAKREAANMNKPLHIVAHSKEVLAILDLCNLSGLFGDPVVISPA